MRKLFSLFAAVLFAGSMMAAVGNLYYTATFLKGTSAAGDNISGYASSGDYTTNGITWTIPGNNTNGDYIRIGGKSLTSVERVIASQSAFGDAIAKIVISHNGKSRNEITVDSVVLTVASNSTFTTNVVKKTVKAPTVAKTTAGTIEFLADEKWEKDRYYKFSFFISNSSTSNGGLDVQSIAFYSYLNPASPSITAANIDFGTVVAMAFPVEKNAELAVTGANLGGVAVSYEVLGSNVTATGTLTADGGTLNVTLSANAEGAISDTIVLTSGTTVTKVPVEANVIQTTGDGTKANPFSVADVVKINSSLGNDKYWVIGYIVGSAANGGTIGDDAQSNLALGDAADQTENLAPVELPTGDVRTALNPKDNPSNKGKVVKVHGQLTNYFLVNGVKAVDEYEWVATPTAIDNNAVEAKAVKTIKNGQLFIEKNGVVYNVLGEVVR